jgi:hypothetical protein
MTPHLQIDDVIKNVLFDDGYVTTQETATAV